MTGLGLLFGGTLALAYRFLKVEEDPRIDETEERLPGNNCGACSQPGCRAFAEKLVAGELEPSRCTVASAAALDDIAAYLGVAVGAASKQVARLRCAGGEGLVAELAAYRGQASCRAAVLVDGGGRACPWGCLGLADCERACTFDAIVMTPQGLPQVDPDKCTACGDCVDVCPLDLFVLNPSDQKVFVQCNSPLAGHDATSRCAVACDACGLCAKASRGKIVMAGNLPRVDTEDLSIPPDVTWKCPTGAIQWVEHAQFEAPKADDLGIGDDHA
ncbi:MAG: Fe-S cluster protein [Proteobacteria bacterium]|nr:MAG: Fe-S cluster protein [Pseudomonadota bacterium]